MFFFTVSCVLSIITNPDRFETMRRVFFIFFYFLQSPTNAQLIDKLLYCSYMFRHYFVILRELVVITLLSYTSVSVQSLVIHFKISHVLCC